MSETQLSHAIGIALLQVGIPSERVHAGRVKVRGGWMHCASEGAPDRMTPYGLLEIKLPGEEPSEAQIAWHTEWRAHGVNIETVDSVKRAVSVALGWRHEREKSARAGAVRA